jgi:plastocyanin
LTSLALFTLAACRSDDPTLGQGGAACAPRGTTLAISANDLKFDKTCLAAPPDESLTINFDNKEALPHNVAIRNKQGDGDLFTGEIISGPRVITYKVRGLERGIYRFWCTIHPSQMQGTFVVE